MIPCLLNQAHVQQWSEWQQERRPVRLALVTFLPPLDLDHPLLPIPFRSFYIRPPPLLNPPLFNPPLANPPRSNRSPGFLLSTPFRPCYLEAYFLKRSPRLWPASNHPPLDVSQDQLPPFNVSPYYAAPSLQSPPVTSRGSTSPRLIFQSTHPVIASLKPQEIRTENRLQAQVSAATWRSRKEGSASGRILDQQIVIHHESRHGRLSQGRRPLLSLHSWGQRGGGFADSVEKALVADGAPLRCNAKRGFEEMEVVVEDWQLVGVPIRWYRVKQGH